MDQKNSQTFNCKFSGINTLYELANGHFEGKLSWNGGRPDTEMIKGSIHIRDGKGIVLKQWRQQSK